VAGSAADTVVLPGIRDGVKDTRLKVKEWTFKVNDLSFETITDRPQGILEVPRSRGLEE